MMPMPFTLESLALLLFIAGALALTALHWRRWRDDRQRAAHQPTPAVCALNDAPRVSLLVPAWNEIAHIDAHIESYKRLTYPNKELILCAGGSDGTYAAALRHQRDDIRVIEQIAGEGKQSALRRSLTLADGEIIFLTDADCLLDDAAFTCALAPLINDGKSAMTGRFAPLPHQRENALVAHQWAVDNYARSFSPQHVEGLIGRNAAVRRAVLEQVGGFDEPVRIGTDYWLARKLARAGVPIRYVHASCVQTEFKDRAAPYLRQQSRWMRNILLHGRTLGATAQVRSALIQCAVGAGVLLSPLTILLIGWFGLVLWALLVWYGTLARWRYLRFAEITVGLPRRARFYAFAPALFLLDQWMLTYTLIEWLLPTRRWSW